MTIANKAILRRHVGSSDTQLGVLALGGHGFTWDPKTELDESAKTLNGEHAAKLVKQAHDLGVTHIDVTYARERHVVGDALTASGLAGAMHPILWHMEPSVHQEENGPQDVIDNVEAALEELGSPGPAMLITSARGGKVTAICNGEIAPWYPQAIEELKQRGLVSCVGYGIMNGGPAVERQLYEMPDIWDFVCPYWSYSLRRNQWIVEWARERGKGVHVVGPLGRGAFLKWPGVKPAEFIKPWIKWILREPAVCSIAMTCQSSAQLLSATAACDGEPMTLEECLCLQNLNLPIQLPNYRYAGDEIIPQGFEVTHPEAFGSNMVNKRDFIRRCEVTD